MESLEASDLDAYFSNIYNVGGTYNNVPGSNSNSSLASDSNSSSKDYDFDSSSLDSSMFNSNAKTEKVSAESKNSKQTVDSKPSFESIADEPYLAVGCYTGHNGPEWMAFVMFNFLVMFILPILVR